MKIYWFGDKKCCGCVRHIELGLNGSRAHTLTHTHMHTNCVGEANLNL